VEFTAFPWERKANPQHDGGDAGGGDAAGGELPGSSGWATLSEEDAEAWVLLKRLRHPLLQGWYLQEKTRWRQAQVRRVAATSPSCRLPRSARGPLGWPGCHGCHRSARQGPQQGTLHPLKSVIVQVHYSTAVALVYMSVAHADGSCRAGEFVIIQGQ